MKFKLIFICLFGMIFTIQAQNNSEKKGHIIGKVMDKRTNEPLSHINVTVKSENKLVSSVITNDKGSFEIENLAFKNYTVIIQFMGYKTVTKTVSLTSKESVQIINTIFLDENSTQLSEVEIVNERSIIEQKSDRKVINVGKDLLSAGTTAAEILDNIPSVTVDQQTKEVSLRGNSNVRVFVDGKPTTISASQLLQQIPATSIKQVELITNPSAKYNPEGNSGIINIVLNKNSKAGFNGSINGGVTFGETPKFNGSTDMNYRNGKVNFYGNYGVNSGKQERQGFVNVTESGEENSQLFNFDNTTTSNLLKAGVDYYINDSNTLSFYTVQNASDTQGNSISNVDFKDPAKQDIIQLYNNDQDNYTQRYDLAYKKKFKKEGHTLEIEGNHNSTDNTDNAIYSTPEINYITNDGKSSLINLDYTNPLSETAKLELGLESRIENTENIFLLNNAYNSDFTYDRKIYSLYGNYSKKLGKWNLQLGARLEDYNAKAEFRKVNEPNGYFEDDRFTIYPSAFTTYAPNENNSFNFSISKRVDRPSIAQINPIRERSSPQIDFIGNPELEPQFTNSIEFNYTRKTKLGSITSGVFYRRINDEITRSLFENPNDPQKVILTFDNQDDNDAYGIEVSGNLEFAKWYSANISLDAYYRTVKGFYNKTVNGALETFYVEANTTTFNARISNTFKASKNLRFQLTGMYRGSDINITAISEPMWRVDAGTSLTILKGKGTITARVSDVFDSMQFAFERSEPKEANGQFNWESQTAFIGFNYIFGSGKNKALQRKARENNEVQGGGGF
jgi:hypothetical protein